MNNGVLKLELVWWVVTAILVLLFMLPIIQNVGGKYEFYYTNVFFIILFITLTRYIFLLKYTFIADRRWVKLVLIFLPIPLFLFGLNALYDFQDFIDQDSHINMLNHLGPDQAMSISKYIQYQYIFFGTGTMIVLALLPVRMVISIWRSMNRGTV